MFEGKKLAIANFCKRSSQQLLEWGVAEILIYGCEVAKEPTLLQQLYNLTGANIAASEYKLGKGNWDLEWQIGEISSESGFTEELKQDYQGEFQIVPVVLESEVTFDVGDGPQSVAIGDFNNDSKADLVVANRGDFSNPGNTVSVLLGEGSGSFGDQQTFAVGSFPNSIAVADFNGDSNPDIAVTNQNDNNVSILLGDGNGSFGEAITFAAADSPNSIAVADFNGDSNPDIAVAERGFMAFSGIHLLLGDGEGSFGEAITFAAGNNPVSIAVADFNGDSNPDIAVASSFSSSASVLIGDGNGSFGEPTSFATNNQIRSIAIGDFNGDSNPDLAVVSSFPGSASILIGDGNGSFGEPTSFAAGNNPNLIAVGDFNGDSNLDIALIESFGSLSILLGEGNGSFGNLTTFAAGNDVYSVAVGDLDGDGKADDIAWTNDPFSGDDSVSVVLLECFLTGTHILTDKGEVAVENLEIGDNVVTAEGKLEPVKWIGYQTVAPHQVKNPLRGYPILIKEGALGNNLPQRDLYVSPDHAMYFEGVLINAGALVNGTSIVKTEPQEAFTYYHVELENHALLLAEGASAESYLPQNEDRLAYENGAEYEELYPHGSNLMLWPMDYPRISSWNKVPRYMRKKLNLIAEELGLVVKAA